jgi:hypothetical protein
MAFRKGSLLVLVVLVASLAVPALARGDAAVVRSYTWDQVAGEVLHETPVPGGAMYTQLQLNMWQIIPTRGPVTPEYSAIVTLARWFVADDGSSSGTFGAFCLPLNGTSMPPGSMTFGASDSSIHGDFGCEGTSFTISVDLRAAATGEPDTSTDTNHLEHGVQVMKTTQTPANMTGTVMYDGLNWAEGGGTAVIYHGDWMEVRAG